MQTWNFPSSSSPKIYTVQINPTSGLLSCSCPGWTVKKLGKTRECKHTKAIKVDEALIVTVRDGQEYVTGATDPYPIAQSVTSSALTAKTSDKASQVAHYGIPPMTNVPGGTIKNPGFVNPMLASKMPDGLDASFYETGEWVMEEKYDGHRLIVKIEGRKPIAKISAWSRLGNTRTLPQHLIEVLVDMPNGIYDGELIVPGSHSYDVSAGMNAGIEALVLFDMVEALGQDIKQNTFAERRAFLEAAYEAVTLTTVISVTQQFTPSTTKVKEIWARGGEGAIIKKLKSKYQPGWRTPDWIKVKKVLAATLTVIGYEDGKNGPYSIVKIRDPLGIETTVKTLDNETMRQIAANPDSFIGKRLVISYQEKMPSGKYRHPCFDHWAGELEI